MKNKIYGKLFEFCDPKSWVKYSISGKYTSTFYDQYELELKCGDLGWYYLLYKSYSGRNGRKEYETSSCHEGFITLNIGGKVLFTLTIVMFTYLISVIFNVPITFDIKHILMYLGYIVFVVFLSFFIFSINNWKIYKALRRAQNIEKIKSKESDEILNTEIVQIVNSAVANNPKLARKNKLKKLNKKYFWQ
jgi:hypothetical protein